MAGLTLGGTWVHLREGWTWLGVTGLLASAAGLTAIGTATHTAAHGVSSARTWLNESLAFLGFPLLLGISVTWFRSTHIPAHHTHTNVLGADTDIEFGPWFRLGSSEPGDLQGYYRYQWLLLPAAIAGNAARLSLLGWRHLLQQIRMPSTVRAAHVADLTLMLGHCALWIGVPVCFVAPSLVLQAYLARLTLLGLGFFLVAAPAHLPEEAALLDGPDVPTDFVMHQTATTLNYEPGAVGRLFTCGAEYQIEHHLFPDISHVHYRKMSPLVRAFCTQHGYPYRTQSWWQGVRGALAAFLHPRRPTAAPK